MPSFDWATVAAKHYSHAVFRAVAPRPEQAVLVADVPLGTADAPAMHLGNWVGWLCLVGRNGPLTPGGVGQLIGHRLKEESAATSSSLRVSQGSWQPLR